MITSIDTPVIRDNFRINQLMRMLGNHYIIVNIPLGYFHQHLAKTLECSLNIHILKLSPYHMKNRNRLLQTRIIK
jgi:hypothetical protein